MLGMLPLPGLSFSSLFFLWFFFWFMVAGVRAADYEFAMDHNKLAELLEILTEFRDALSLRALPLADLVSTGAAPLLLPALFQTMEHIANHATGPLALRALAAELVQRLVAAGLIIGMVEGMLTTSWTHPDGFSEARTVVTIVATVTQVHACLKRYFDRGPLVVTTPPSHPLPGPGGAPTDDLDPALLPLEGGGAAGPPGNRNGHAATPAGATPGDVRTQQGVHQAALDLLESTGGHGPPTPAPEHQVAPSKTRHPSLAPPPPHPPPYSSLSW